MPYSNLETGPYRSCFSENHCSHTLLCGHWFYSEFEVKWWFYLITYASPMCTIIYDWRQELSIFSDTAHFLGVPGIRVPWYLKWKLVNLNRLLFYFISTFYINTSICGFQKVEIIFSSFILKQGLIGYCKV
jgi:hypothetical protein